MNGIKKIVGLNLLVLLGYTLLVNLGTSGENERELAVMIYLAILIVLHTGINLVAAIAFFIRKNKTMGKNYLLSALIILVIGFSACWGSASL